MNLHDLIKAIQAHQDPKLHPFTETLLAVLDNASDAGTAAGISVSQIDSLQALQIGIAAIIDGAALKAPPRENPNCPDCGDQLGLCFACGAPE